MSSKTTEWYHLPAKSRSSGYSKRRKIRQRHNKSMRSRSSSSSHNATWRSVSSNEAKRQLRTRRVSLRVKNLARTLHARDSHFSPPKLVRPRTA